tara:strand:- start:152 stop:304 length:153 start_codon:yes stop_codon:yes gene_type:complete
MRDVPLFFFSARRGKRARGRNNPVSTGIDRQGTLLFFSALTMNDSRDAER